MISEDLWVTLSLWWRMAWSLGLMFSEGRSFFPVKIAVKPPDSDHAYGHGKAELISASCVVNFREFFVTHACRKLTLHHAGIDPMLKRGIPMCTLRLFWLMESTPLF